MDDNNSCIRNFEVQGRSKGFEAYLGNGDRKTNETKTHKKEQEKRKNKEGAPKHWCTPNEGTGERPKNKRRSTQAPWARP